MRTKNKLKKYNKIKREKIKKKQEKYKAQK